MDPFKRIFFDGLAEAFSGTNSLYDLSNCKTVSDLLKRKQDLVLALSKLESKIEQFRSSRELLHSMHVIYKPGIVLPNKHFSRKVKEELEEKQRKLFKLESVKKKLEQAETQVDQKLIELKTEEETKAGRNVPTRKSLVFFPNGESKLNVSLLTTPSLEVILNTPVMCKYLVQFVDTEFNTENLLFWKEAEWFSNSVVEINQIEGDQQTKNNLLEVYTQRAQKICDKYLKENAFFELNVDNLMRSKVIKDTKEGKVNDQLFKNIQKRIFELLQSNSYTRFIHSGEFYEKMMIEITTQPEPVPRSSSASPLPSSSSVDNLPEVANQKKREIRIYMPAGGFKTLIEDINITAKELSIRCLQAYLHVDLKERSSTSLQYYGLIYVQPSGYQFQLNDEDKPFDIQESWDIVENNVHLHSPDRNFKFLFSPNLIKDLKETDVFGKGGVFCPIKVSIEFTNFLSTKTLNVDKNIVTAQLCKMCKEAYPEQSLDLEKFKLFYTEPNFEYIMADDDLPIYIQDAWASLLKCYRQLDITPVDFKWVLKAPTGPISN